MQFIHLTRSTLPEQRSLASRIENWSDSHTLCSRVVDVGVDEEMINVTDKLEYPYIFSFFQSALLDLRTKGFFLLLLMQSVALLNETSN